MNCLTPHCSTVSGLHEKHKAMRERMKQGVNLPASILEQCRAEAGGLRQRWRKESEGVDTDSAT